MTADERRLLLVDDDPDFLEITGAVLEGAGYRVERCGDPEAAVEAAAAFRPHLVLSDLMMSRLDSGFTLARRLKEDPRLAGVPVLIVTAVGSALGFDLRPRTADELAAAHADGWLEKPVAPEALLAAVRGLLDRPAGEGGP